MERKSLIIGAVLLVVAVLSGFGGSWLGKSYLQAQRTALILENKQASAAEMVNAIVPGRDLAKGEKIATSNMVVRPIPRNYAPADMVMIADFKRVEGDLLTTGLARGNTLTWHHITGTANRTFADLVKPGMRAYTLPINDLNSFSGMLLPGDSIDLLLVESKKGASGVTLLLDNKVVMATDQMTSAQMIVLTKPKGFTYSTITLQVTPEEAQRLIMAQQAGRIITLLRNRRDAEPGDFGFQPEPVAQAPSVVQPPVSAPVFPVGVEYIVGGVGGEPQITKQQIN